MNQVVGRPTAIVAHQQWGRGGAEAAALWIIDALTRDFDVTVYTCAGFNLDELNLLAGTAVNPESLKIKKARKLAGCPVGAITAGVFRRSLPSIGAAFDLRVSASGVLKWGRPALHFISSVEWNRQLAAQVDAARKEALRTRLSRWLSDRIAGPVQILSRDRIVANSTWLRRKCGPFYSGPIEIIHPVVPLLPEVAPWSGREDAVLVFGRISPEKRVEDAIRIVGLARTAGFGGRLVISGPDGAIDYAAHIRDLAARHEWIEILPGQFGADKARLLGRMRYGVNACRIEAFGISTAEMAASGIIMLVPKDTGQNDIVDDPSQQFSTVEDAANKLVALANSPDLQRRLHSRSGEVRSRFAPDRFKESVRCLAQAMIAE